MSVLAERIADDIALGGGAELIPELESLVAVASATTNGSERSS